MTQKVAIITAAGSGMGAAIARKLANDNYKVSILSPTPQANCNAACQQQTNDSSTKH